MWENALQPLLDFSLWLVAGFHAFGAPRLSGNWGVQISFPSQPLHPAHLSLYP